MLLTLRPQSFALSAVWAPSARSLSEKSQQLTSAISTANKVKQERKQIISKLWLPALQSYNQSVLSNAWAFWETGRVQTTLKASSVHLLPSCRLQTHSPSLVVSQCFGHLNKLLQTHGWTKWSIPCLALPAGSVQCWSCHLTCCGPTGTATWALPNSSYQKKWREKL